MHGERPCEGADEGCVKKGVVSESDVETGAKRVHEVPGARMGSVKRGEERGGGANPRGVFVEVGWVSVQGIQEKIEEGAKREDVKYLSKVEKGV